MTTADGYQTLEIQPDATKREIGGDYRRPAFQYHPDRNLEDTEVDGRKKRIDEASGPGYHDFQMYRSDFFPKGFVCFGPPGEKGKDIAGEALPGPIRRLGRYLFKKWIPEGKPEKGADIHDVIALNFFHAENGGPYAYYLRQKDKKLIVQIPKGVKNGQQIRLARLGQGGKRGGAPGDVLLRVKIKRTWLQRIKDRLSKR